MKCTNGILLLFLLFAAVPVCGAYDVAATEDTICYRYHAEAEPSMFDEILVLVRSGNEATCMYYGPSIEFDDSPEPFLPGFIMLEATDFVMGDGKISFKLNPAGRRYYSQPVELNLRTDGDVISSGYKLWIQAPEFFWMEVTFEGTYDNDSVSICNKTLRPEETKIFYKEPLRDVMKGYKRSLIDAESEREDNAG